MRTQAYVNRTTVLLLKTTCVADKSIVCKTSTPSKKTKAHQPALSKAQLAPFKDQMGALTECEPPAGSFFPERQYRNCQKSTKTPNFLNSQEYPT